MTVFIPTPLQTAINHIAAACAAANIEYAIICPGSRNAPLTMAFARHPGIRCQSVIDERSAGFIALGMCKALHLPVAIICTSGSAVVNLYPAVLEAFYQRIPLIIITADRPPELIDQWDGQAIHQPGIFGKHVKASYNLPDEYSNPEKFGSIMLNALEMAISNNPGPVHVNVPLREPLYSAVNNSFEYLQYPYITNGDFFGRQVLPQSDLKPLQNAINIYQKILIVVGESGGNPFYSNIEEQIAKKIPVISDVLSEHPLSIHYSDVLLSIPDESLKKQLQPDVLITFGTSMVSKNIKQFLRKYKPQYHYHISKYGETANPFETEVIQLHGYVWKILENINFANLNTKYFQLWEKYNTHIATTTKNYLAGKEFNEMVVVNEVINMLPQKSILQLANSMPIRWVNMLKREQLASNDITTWGTRGVSGIEGCVSTAVGVAYVYEFLEKRDREVFVTLLTGDVAFFYDSNALWNKFVTPNLRIVILNNGGGGIFRMIDGPSQMPELEEFVETTHTRTAKLLAQDMNVDYTKAENFEELEAALKVFYNPSERPKILEIFTDSKINAEFFKNYKKQIQDGLENL